MYILLQDYDNGGVYGEHYWFINQVVTNDDEGKVLTFTTMDEVKDYIHNQYAQYKKYKQTEAQIIRDDDSAFSYSDGYDEITGYKWIDLNNPVIPETASDLIADFLRNRYLILS